MPEQTPPPPSSQRRWPRASGLLLHPTSLPGGQGIGDLGDEAYRFVDFLAAAEQRLWQILPLGPPDADGSPYAAESAFAGNPLLISLAALAEEGLLDSDDLASAPDAPAERVDFARVRAAKLPRLRRAYERFAATGGLDGPDFGAFREQARDWLDDYALYAALKAAHGGRDWRAWPAELRQRQPAVLNAARARLSVEVGFQQFLQYAFDAQWSRLKRYANARDVHLVGDLPIFVALDSADVWAHPEQFKLTPAGEPIGVAGVPPDYFSAEGQLWGNPVYDWERQRAGGFAWWIERFRWTLRQVELVRLDHFRGFQASWQVPAGERTAIRGEWVPGPGAALFAALAAALGPLPIIVEDLGLITPDVIALREQLGYPGMRVLQFAFGGDADNPHLPHNYVHNCVVYTGTHDNDTSVGWFAGLDDRTRGHLLRYLGYRPGRIHLGLLRLALASIADIAIAPVQDVLGLGSEARMNVPGRAGGNWSWRLRAGQLSPDCATSLAELSHTYGRANRWTPSGT